MTLSAVLALCALSAVEITMSPDQPLAYSYVDDPFIVEVRSDTAQVADITITLAPGAGGEAISKTFSDSRLGPGINRWCAVKDMPQWRGPWTVEVTVASGAETANTIGTIYRINRPAEAFAHPLYASGDSNAVNRDALLALRSVAVNRVRIPAGDPAIEALLAEMAGLEMQAIVAFDRLEDVAATAGRLRDHCPTIARWEVPVSDDVEALRAAVAQVQALPCTVPVTLRFDDTQDIGARLKTIAPELLQFITIRQSEGDPEILEETREALAGLGVESPQVDYLYGPDASTGKGQFLKLYFKALSHRASRVAFPVQWVMDGGELQPGLADLNALAHGVPPGSSHGDLPRDGLRALLFARGGEWTLPFWSREDQAVLAVEWDDANALRLLDRWSNPIGLPEPADGALAIPAVTDLRLLQGRGGPLPREVLLHQIRNAVSGILDDPKIATAWSEPARETLKAIGESPISDASRVRFFTLLREFPAIEERWHAGQLPRPVAVAALSELAALSRLLCRVEAVRGATFLEPLHDTLARCEEYQSLYLTGTTATPQARARGDWLVQEVRRLMDEVEYLLAEGSKIEADAVAALAEWRARGLEFAAKAGPLSDRLTLSEPEGEDAINASESEGNEKES